MQFRKELIMAKDSPHITLQRIYFIFIFLFYCSLDLRADLNVL